MLLILDTAILIATEGKEDGIAVCNLMLLPVLDFMLFLLTVWNNVVLFFMK
jgi:hypothetical protein